MADVGQDAGTATTTTGQPNTALKLATSGVSVDVNSARTPAAPSVHLSSASAIASAGTAQTRTASSIAAPAQTGADPSQPTTIIFTDSKGKQQILNRPVLVPGETATHHLGELTKYDGQLAGHLKNSKNLGADTVQVLAGERQLIKNQIIVVAPLADAEARAAEERKHAPRVKVVDPAKAENKALSQELIRLKLEGKVEEAKTLDPMKRTLAEKKLLRKIQTENSYRWGLPTK